MSGSLLDTYLVSKIVKVHDFVPDLKVGRVMPVVINPTTLFCRTKNEITHYCSKGWTIRARRHFRLICVISTNNQIVHYNIS